MEENTTFTPEELLYEVYENQGNALLSMEATDDGFDKVSKNFDNLAEKHMDLVKVTNDWEKFNANLALEKEKLEFEKEKFQREEESKSAELEHKKNQLKFDKVKLYVESGIQGIGILIGTYLTGKTLKVNLESYISDKDAVRSAESLLNRFLRKK